VFPGYLDYPIISTTTCYNQSSYREFGFDHYTVNQPYNFVDSTTGALTQTINHLCLIGKVVKQKQWGKAHQYQFIPD